jgi:predicted AAA+ superfamily ATPase
MRYLQRDLAKRITTAARSFPALVLTGPRRAGKTYLLRRLFPRASYYLFEDPDVVGRFRHDPQGFLDGVRLPVILDEIQNVPEVFNFVRARITARFLYHDRLGESSFAARMRTSPRSRVSSKWRIFSKAACARAVRICASPRS